MHPELSFEQAPPIAAPYRFFLTAPWFSVAAGLLLAFDGESALATRWSAQALGLTHLLTVGFMLQAMCGALLQFVPVAAGGNVPRPRLVAGVVHPLLLVGATLLVAGFLAGRGVLLLSALGPLVLGTLVFVAAIGHALWKVPLGSQVLAALRVAVGGLLATVAVGAFMAWTLGRGETTSLLELTVAHAAWGLGAWALALLCGVSLYVVPMFQLTPTYPSLFARATPFALLVFALCASIGVVYADGAWQLVATIGTFTTGATYAVLTIRLQRRRRRRVTDPTYWFFRVAMVSALIAAALVLAAQAVPRLAGDTRLTLTMGVLVIGGGFVTAINGMLYKIMPFINWLHLQRLAGMGAMPPNMREMLGEGAMRGQMRMHFIALGGALAAVWAPVLARPAGILWTCSAAWLGINLIHVVRRYVDFRDRIRADASCHAP